MKNKKNAQRKKIILIFGSIRLNVCLFLFGFRMFRRAKFAQKSSSEKKENSLCLYVCFVHVKIV